ncbi:MAG: MBL fold metallo-hydrolase, partial [Betaproteobacteria bacterium]|nr:MBL fold metallo-hydrolase [Betaproteobacteria bacterium]
MHYRTVPVTHFEQNCSLLWCADTLRAAFVDPGGDLPRLVAAAQQQGVQVDKVLLTHAHIDHAGASAAVAAHYGVPIEGPHEDDQFWIDALEQQAAVFGFRDVRRFTPTRWLHDGDTVQVGRQTLAVRHCPGHTPGHVVFHHAGARRAFVGDVLFRGSIGRTDFPRGDYDTLIASITGRLWPLGSTAGDDTVFIPGHGPESSFAYERAH